MNQFATYLDVFQHLNCGRVGNHERPHKPVLLLTVIDLIDNGQISRNQIRLSPELLEVFQRYFQAVRTQNDSPTPINPFFYLRSDKFWHHQPRPGQENVCTALRAPGSMASLANMIDYAYLDEALFALLLDPVKREAMRQALIVRYFPAHKAALMEIVNREHQIGLYERELQRQLGQRRPDSTIREAGEDIRQAGFRRRGNTRLRLSLCRLRLTGNPA
jgi:putative restriction endonuclease